MSFLTSLFRPAALTNAYNGIRNVLGSVYRPINYAINKIGSTISSVDQLLNRGKDLPVLRDLIGIVQGNPLYQAGLNLTRDVVDGVNVAGSLGSALDNTITKELQGLQIARPNIIPSPPGSVASLIK